MAYDYDTADPFYYGLLKGYAAENRKFQTDEERLLWRCPILENKTMSRGLASLLNVNQINLPENSPSDIEIILIDANPYQPRRRFDREQILELAESIKKHGVLQPVLLRKKDGGRYELIAGERRLRASKEAGLRSIPAIIRDVTDIQSLELAIIENVQDRKSVV